MLKVPLFDKQVCFHLGTENGEKQIKKHPYLLLCVISEDIRRTIKRFSFKEVLWLIRLGMVSQLEMQTCQQIHHARWELPPLRWMMSFLPPWPCLPPLLPHDQYSWVANETLWCDRQYSRSCACFSFSKNLISVSLHVMSLSISNPRTKYQQLSIFPFPKMTSFSSKIDQFLITQLEVVFL